MTRAQDIAAGLVPDLLRLTSRLLAADIVATFRCQRETALAAIDLARNGSASVGRAGVNPLPPYRRGAARAAYPRFRRK